MICPPELGPAFGYTFCSVGVNPKLYVNPLANAALADPSAFRTCTLFAPYEGDAGVTQVMLLGLTYVVVEQFMPPT
jgi:hypothetical protein